MKDFFKKFKMPIIIGTIVLVIVIILIVVFGGNKSEKLTKIDKTQSVSKAYQLIAPNYKNIDCTGDCDYFYAYKGEEDLQGIIEFFDETGSKLGSLNLKGIDPKLVATMDIEGISKNYYIVSYMDTEELSYNYVVYNMKGKVLSEAEDAEAITDKYFVVDKDEKSYLLDNTGKVVYENVENVKSYNDEFITLSINESDKIIKNNGEEVLSGYTIAKAVLDEDDNVDYLIVKNSEESVYNYYNIDEKTKKGDSFTSYTTNDEDQIIITKKVDSKSQKFVLNSNGEQVKYEDEKTTTSDGNYYDEIKDKVDTEKYGIFSTVINEENQNYILVNLNSENKFGVLDIAKDEFKELGTYKENSSRRLTLKRISSNKETEGNNDVIYSIECSKYYCDNNVQFIYNFSENKLLSSKDSTKESLIYLYRIYENGYSVLRTTSSSHDDSSMYFLYDKDGKELAQSKSDIKIIDSELAYYSSSVNDTGKVNLYSVNDKKIINIDSDDEIASISSKNFDDQEFYQFTMDDSTYLVSADGDVAKIDGSLKSSDDVGMYLSKDGEIYYYNVFTKEESSYKLADNESINGSTGSELIPYRNAIFVNNSFDYIIKVIGVDGKVLLEKKDLQIYKIEKKSDGSILMIVVDKNDNKGIYIVR